MPRPTQRTPSRVADFSPEQREAVPLGVFAPLDVRAPDSGATRLAAALGLLNDVVQPELAARAEREAFSSTSEGMADAQLGRVDPKRAAEDRAYSHGMKRVAVEHTAQKAFSEWSERYEQTNLKERGEDDVSADFDAFMRERLGALANDPEAAKWTFDRIAPLSEKVLTAHRARLAEEFRQEAISAAGGALRADVATGKAVNPEDIMSMLRPVLGNSEAAKQYVDMVGALAVERRDPALIDSLIPEKWADGTPGARSAPALNEVLNKARYLAESAAEQDEREARAAVAARIDVQTIGILQKAAGGDLSGAIADLDALAAQGGMTAAEYTARRNYIEGRRDYLNEHSYNPAALAEFRMQIADDPLNVAQADVIAEVSRLFPADRNGTQMAASLLDDLVATQRAAKAARANPIAKAYRSSLVSKYKPDASLSTQAMKDRYSAVMLAFDLEFAQSSDPQKALTAAEEIVKGTTTPANTATGSLAADLKALAAGNLSGSAFAQKHGADRSVDAIAEAVRRGDLSTDEGARALDALGY